VRGPTIPTSPVPRNHSGTPAQLSLFHRKESAATVEKALVDGDLPSWLARFLREATQETDTLRENGAEHAAAARTGLLKKLLHAAQAYTNTELDAGQAARETGCCEETIRRAVRNGAIPDRRANPRGRHKIRRGDLQRIAGGTPPPYDPIADAQSIAQLRRKL
jgi:hypothetical protein